MRRFKCRCDSPLFFDNTQCSACDHLVGWCDACGTLTTLTETGTCAQQECGACLIECVNRHEHLVCNGFVVADADISPLCRNCQRTSVGPDASNTQYVAQWRTMEAAKRRLLYDLRLIGLDDRALDAAPTLTFRFMADTPEKHVVTGHVDGVITVNLAEANPVEREAARQQFGEPQRTVIGHLRHECGHYLWQKFVNGSHDLEFREKFGDHQRPTYEQALKKYYEHGAPANWSDLFISRYSSSHPWEDFAETAAFYLDMRSVLDTLAWFAPSLANPLAGSFEGLLRAYLCAGVALNEVNRTMGLTDLVPEVIGPRVADKLRFVHATLVHNE